MPRHRSRRFAFTLLEVILALGLSALLIGVLAMAIQTSMKATYGGRADVARAQLARAALARIGADLRSAVWYEPLDPYSLVVPPAVSSLAPSTSGGSGGAGGTGGAGGAGGSQASAGAGGSTNASSSSGSSSSRSGGSSSGGSSSGGASGGSRSSSGSSAGGGASGSGGGASSSSGMSGGNRGGGGGSSGGGMGGSGGGGSSSSSSGSATTTTTPMPLPMFVGGQNWLQVDISHLPRPDQYAFLQFSSAGMSGGNMAASSSSGGSSSGGSSGANPMAQRDRISEIKTVFYFLAGGGGQGLPPGLSSSMAGGKQQGLMRREADRIVTAWTSYGGGSSGLGPAVEGLAPEIATLQFKYFNGSTWTNTWDSRINYSLPRAVEITITLAEETAASADRPASSAAIKQAPPRQYVLRVPLPAWRPPNLQVLNSMAIQAQQNASSGSSSSSSTSTGAAGMGSY